MSQICEKMELFVEDIPKAALVSYDELFFEEATLRRSRKPTTLPDKIIGHEEKYDLNFYVGRYPRKGLRCNHYRVIAEDMGHDRRICVVSVRNLKAIDESSNEIEHLN